ncbi:MSHA biogenesis protein MshP [Vibrio ordalii]|uniref:MSHA biogenesis protein MshP n=1 Tax=Vibrio ordalii TaxID=28174 RepID=UPI00257841E0|nr:MSHA biogenesis protein MshP [Vibrio ordalii]MCS0352015.1 MSHA biogenesis protein MshP [Vibrio ordalii]
MMRLSTTRRKQQGSGLVLVIFIIVVVGFVASVANRNQQRNSQQLVSMVLGTRAEMAARSAVNIAISRYYQNDANSSCRGVEQNVQLVPPDYTPVTRNFVFQGDGLDQCSVTLSCRFIGKVDDAGAVYQLTSTGRCQAGDWTLQRVIEVGVKSDSL